MTAMKPKKVERGGRLIGKEMQIKNVTRGLAGFEQRVGLKHRVRRKRNKCVVWSEDKFQKPVLRQEG